MPFISTAVIKKKKNTPLQNTALGEQRNIFFLYRWFFIRVRYSLRISSWKSRQNIFSINLFKIILVKFLI